MTPADKGTAAVKADDAEREYEAAYRAHQTAVKKYRALEIGDEQFVASFNLLKERRERHELFIFKGTDNENVR